MITAEEFFEQSGTYPELAIEFAKLHVQKALEKVKDETNHLDAFYEDRTWWIPQDSIIIDYFLKDIK